MDPKFFERKQAVGRNLVFAEVVSLLHQAAEETKNIWIVVNALDEYYDSTHSYPNRSEQDLLKILLSLRKVCNMNLLATSRPHGRIGKRIGDGVEVEANEDDLRVILEVNLEYESETSDIFKDKNICDEIVDEIVDKLTRSSKGTYAKCNALTVYSALTVYVVFYCYSSN